MRWPLTVSLILAAATAMAAPAGADEPREAHASGGDVVPLIYPSLVDTRVKRAERAVRRVTRQFEDGHPAAAAASLKVVRRQMSAAWRGAWYVIRTAPPPAEEARASGDGPVGPAYAAPAETAFAVLSLQHDVAAGVVELVDGGHGTGVDALSRTLYLALDRRLRSIRDIRVLAPPAADEARTSGDDESVAGFETVMPNVIGQVEDELQAVRGLRSDASDLTPAGRRLLERAEPLLQRTKQLVSATWPLLPAED